MQGAEGRLPRALARSRGIRRRGSGVRARRPAALPLHAN